MTDAVMGTWSYTYDDFNRLTGGSATAGVDSGLALGWTYDRYGNRWAQNATGSGNATAVQPQLSFTGNNNHVDGWSYDAAGNLLNDGRNSYAYDAEGRIVALNGQPMYLYDAEGRRVAKYSGSTVTARYLLDLAGQQVTELNAAGAWMHSNVWTAGGKLLATYEGPGESKPNTWHFHLTDWLGTERMQTNALGQLEETCTSYPFGDGLTCTGSDATEHHFTTKERDAESGLDYFYARYYSSILARFMTPDWAAAPTAVPYATFGDPQTLNLYAYAENNPSRLIDLDGHDGLTNRGDPNASLDVNGEMNAQILGWEAANGGPTASDSSSSPGLDSPAQRETVLGAPPTAQKPDTGKEVDATKGDDGNWHNTVTIEVVAADSDYYDLAVVIHQRAGGMESVCFVPDYFIQAGSAAYAIDAAGLGYGAKEGTGVMARRLLPSMEKVAKAAPPVALGAIVAKATGLWDYVTGKATTAVNNVCKTGTE